MAATTQGRLIDFLKIGHNVDELARKLGDIQLGTAILVAGTCTITSATALASDAQCYLQRAATGGAVTATAQYWAPPTGFSTGDKTVLVTACLTSGSINTADCSTLNFLLLPNGLDLD